MNHRKIWRVALPMPLATYFDYLPCAHQKGDLQPGCRIQVPFGSRKLVGVLLAIEGQTEVAVNKLKQASAVLDNAPLLDAEMLRFCQWVSDYYHHPIGEVIQTAIPRYLRSDKTLPQVDNKLFAISANGLLALATGLARAPRQKELLTLLQQQPRPKDAIKQAGLSVSVLNQAIKKNWVQDQLVAPEEKIDWQSGLKLNTEQQVALQAITTQLTFKVNLLAGVTGSGKTEVYLQAIARVLEQGKQALVLVPEISLTPQTLERFLQRFSRGVITMHSGMTDVARARAWCQAKRGDARIVIGTRSAVFAPLANLGIIIVDEEHDLSFKSHSHLRYSARDVAVMRARMANIPIVLGSATPCLESFYNAKTERYTELVLSQRAGHANMPAVQVIDLRKQKIQAGLSQPLIDAIKQQLDNKKQVLLFINRRGYAPVMLCHQCGFVVSCSRCDARLTLHTAPPRLICHHCDRSFRVVDICPSCHQADLITLGQGTEKIEMALKELFPQQRILRVDRDTTTSKSALEAMIASINNLEVDILVGTQMLAKGHHFGNLGLSAILDIDSGFFSSDFRAIEHQSQIIVQVAGRAGRGETTGAVLIQTHQPEHPHLQLLLQKGYRALADRLLQERHLAHLPPFTYQVMLRADALKKELPLQFLQSVRALLNNTGVKVLGPIPANLMRKSGRYRYQLLLQAQSRRLLRTSLQPLRKKIAELPLVNQIRWSIDVDPVEA